MKDVPQLLVVLFILATALLAIYLNFSRSRSILENWARQNGFQIITRQYRVFARGPFFWTTSKGQTVYYVTVRDLEGRTRRGWVRCGGFFLGLFADKAEVRWSE